MFINIIFPDVAYLAVVICRILFCDLAIGLTSQNCQNDSRVMYSIASNRSKDARLFQ